MEQETKATYKEKKKIDDNIILIGDKPFMNYVSTISMILSEKSNKEVILMARGKFISRAVDLAEFVRKKFLIGQNLKLSDIKINSEELESRENRKVNVSTIEITLKR